MQFFAIIAVVCASSVLVTEAALSEEQKAKLQTYRKDCSASSAVNPELVTKARAGQFQEDPALKVYLVCVAKKVGFVDNAGVPQNAVITEKIGNALDDADSAAKITQECAIQRDNIETTVYESVKCFLEKSPKITNVL